MAGREALVECATSTAQSGYSMRLGVKMMESDVVAYDHTVRDDQNHIIQFLYNGTGLDPQRCSGVQAAGAFCDLDAVLRNWRAQRANSEA